MNENDNNIAREESSQGFIKMRLSLIEYAITHTLDELLTRSLDEVGVLLDSPIGFYHFVEPDGKSISLQQWSTRTLKEFCRTEEKGIHYNIDQAGVWVDCIYQKKAVIHNDYSSLPHKRGLPEGHAKVVRELVVPVMRKDKVVAVLGVGNKLTDYTLRDVEVVSYLADVTWEIVQQKLADDDLRKTSFYLRERVKELSCLYSISKLVDEDDLTIDEILQKTVDLIPPAWQYPEITCAQVKLANRSYRTKRFVKTDWLQSQEIKVDKEKIGILEVYLFEHKPEKGEGTFLTEERSLLNVIAERLGHIIEHKLANEALQKAHDDLQIRVEERTKELAAQNILLQNEILKRKKAEEVLEQRVMERTLELQQSHAQLLHSEKLAAIGNLSASIAHEFNNPLQSVTTILKGVEQYARLGKKEEELIGLALEECHRMKNLIADLGDFFQPTSGKIDQVELHATIDALLLISKKDLHTRNIKIVTRYGDHIPLVMAVVDQLKQVFLNLLNNAADACAGGGMITITTEALGDENIAVHIEDNGRGISSANIDHIFEPFFTTKPELKGTGLGLSVSYGIIKKHGGRIDVTSESGKGARFSVVLPIESGDNEQ